MNFGRRIFYLANILDKPKWSLARKKLNTPVVCNSNLWNHDHVMNIVILFELI